MMETLKSLLETAKATTYELLALLLPGAVVLAAVQHACGIDIPFGTIGTIAAAYLLGTILQGVADFVLKHKWIAPQLESKKTNWQPIADYALGVIQKRLEAVPKEATLDICLTHIGAGRTVYDKFIALRDTARGLAFATLASATLVIVDNWNALSAGSTACAVERIASAIALAILLFLAFLQRYARFHPLAQQVVYGQFLAMQLDLKD